MDTTEWSFYLVIIYISVSFRAITFKLSVLKSSNEFYKQSKAKISPYFKRFQNGGIPYVNRFLGFQTITAEWYIESNRNSVYKLILLLEICMKGQIRIFYAIP